MPENPFSKPGEVAARMNADYERLRRRKNLLDGLKTKSPQNSGHGFIVTEKDDEVIRKGGTPAGYSRDKDGKIRPLVYGN